MIDDLVPVQNTDREGIPFLPLIIGHDEVILPPGQLTVCGLVLWTVNGRNTVSGWPTTMDLISRYQRVAQIKPVLLLSQARMGTHQQ